MKLSHYLLTATSVLVILVSVGVNAQPSLSEAKVERFGKIERVLLQSPNLNLKAEMNDADAVIQKVLAHGVPSRSRRAFEYSIVDDRPAEDRRLRRIGFVQMLNGVPLSGKSTIVMSANGDVISANIIQAEDPLVPTVDEEYAIEIAKKAVADAAGLDSVETKDVSVKFTYDMVDNNMVPFWDIELTVTFDGNELNRDDLRELEREEPSKSLVEKIANSKSYLGSGLHYVRVNAFSGNAVARRPALWNAAAVRVCKHLGGFHGTLSGFSNPNPRCENHDLFIPLFPTAHWYHVYSVFDDWTCVGTSGDCASPTYQSPRNWAKDHVFWLNQKSDACCYVSGATVSDFDIMTNSNWKNGVGFVTSPVYSNAFETVYIPQASLNDTTQFISGKDGGKNKDVVVHETTHHVFSRLNPTVFTRATVNSDVFAKSMIEGFSDTATALYGKLYGENDTDAWKEFAKNYLILPRDMKAPRDLFFHYTNSASAMHNNGRIFGNLFYRLQQEGVSNNTLYNLLTDVMRNIDYQTGTSLSSFDWGDVSHVIRIFKFKPGVPSNFGARFENVWADMGGAPP